MISEDGNRKTFTRRFRQRHVTSGIRVRYIIRVTIRVTLKVVHHPLPYTNRAVLTLIRLRERLTLRHVIPRVLRHPTQLPRSATLNRTYRSPTTIRRDRLFALNVNRNNSTFSQAIFTSLHPKNGNRHFNALKRAIGFRNLLTRRGNRATFFRRLIVRAGNTNIIYQGLLRVTRRNTKLRRTTRIDVYIRSYRNLNMGRLFRNFPFCGGEPLRIILYDDLLYIWC